MEPYGDSWTEEEIGNAHLIAAAPEILDFVKKVNAETNCICHLKHLVAGTSLESDTECTHCAAAALIAKADGRS